MHSIQMNLGLLTEVFCITTDLNMKAATRYAALAVCFVEAAVLGGALFGWPSLVYVLQVSFLYYGRHLVTFKSCVLSLTSMALC